MTTTTAALAALKAALATITSPATPTVYAFPDDATSAPLDLSDGQLPAIVVSKAIDRDQVWSRIANGYARHTYEVTIDVMLTRIDAGPLPAAVKTAEISARAWIPEIARIINANLSLSGNIAIAGDGAALLSPIIEGPVTHEDGDLIQMFYGFTAYARVREDVAQPMDA